MNECKIRDEKDSLIQWCDSYDNDMIIRYDMNKGKMKGKEGMDEGVTITIKYDDQKR
jgi:hypothetical protein